MLSLGLPEILVIMILALVVVGPDRLPEMLRFLGRQYGKLTRASNDLKRAFLLEAEREQMTKRAAEMKIRREEVRRRIAEQRDAALGEKGQDPKIAPVSRGTTSADDLSPPPESNQRDTDTLFITEPVNQPDDSTDE